MAAVRRGLRAERFRADAFAMMCAFLFDHSDVLRRLLAGPPSAERALALSDIVTCLSRAAAYRFLHPEAEPPEARLRFAQHLRASLSTSASSVTPPKTAPDAVRVMTLPCGQRSGISLRHCRRNKPCRPRAAPPRTPGCRPRSHPREKRICSRPMRCFLSA